jgi:plastocyanin
MASRLLFAFLGLCTAFTPIRAAEIHGTIIVRRTLTKRKVTVSADLYDRGGMIPLPPQSSEDPLAFERRHVAVYLEGTHPSEAGSGPVGGNAGPRAVVEQANRQFVPDLVVVPAGSTVSFPNRDPIFHNVFSLSKSKGFDLGNYPKSQTRLVTFLKAGIVVVGCHLHSNMVAFIVVTPGQWGTVADADGGFVLNNVPPGEHMVVAWHKASGPIRKKVHVEEGGSANLEIIVPLLDDAGSGLMQSTSTGSLMPENIKARTRR